jgi:Flp pilus assembly pilin Flp
MPISFEGESTERKSFSRRLLIVRESAKRLAKGQTMTEYALILAAVAIVVFITHEVMDQDIGTLGTNIDTSLTTT